MSLPNGKPAVAVVDERETVVGINFGSAYASIAEGKAECIANEDGERQIAAAISFNGEEMYVGNQALPQLVKNAQNTITNFRNFLGKKFSEISSSELASLAPSAPLIQHPSLPDTPCYAVQVLIPSPTPLTTPASLSSRPSTQHPTPLATPRSEPMPQTRHLTPHDAAVLFFKSLHQSVMDFLGVKPRGVVITVPAWFADIQREAVKEAAKEAGINILQLLEEDTAAAAVLVDAPVEQADRTTLLVDWGATDVNINLLSIRAGLVHSLGSKRVAELGTAQPGSIDETLVKYFAKEFAKKTGEALQVCPPTPSTTRAQIKLFLSLPHIKRSLTASSSPSSSGKPTSTQISIESLHAGLDFSAPVNRTRAFGLFTPVFERLAAAVKDLIGNEGVWVDSVAWVGGGGGAGSTASQVLVSTGVLGEHTKEEEIGQAEEVLAKGCALHARGIIDLAEEMKVDAVDVGVTAKTVGVLVPAADGGEDGDGEGGTWIPIIPTATPLPAKRAVKIPVTADAGTLTLPLEFWEASNVVQTKIIPAEVYSDAEEDEEPAEPTEEKARGVKKETYLGGLDVALGAGVVVKGKKGKPEKSVEIVVEVGVDGKVGVKARGGGAGDWSVV
ncbi:actin-like ATPase domain-containing protein [Hysterangium stoloniferum]|nr:actin-like ATPase domain-containing protein [Hysterangium stoloniferum]